MATAAPAREWTGINTFPAATQAALVELLSRLQAQERNSLTILLLGKRGVGKSSTVNSIIGERVCTVSAFQAEVMRAVMCSRMRSGFTVTLIDTPGLVEAGAVSDHTLESIKHSLLGRRVDVMLYVDRLDSYRVDNLDRQLVKAISDCFGPQIWKISAVVLTHGHIVPPDGLEYGDFVVKRQNMLEKLIQRESSGRTRVPSALVENSGRCVTNPEGEKVLPNGTVWLPKLFETMVDVVLSGAEPLLIDQRLLEGPNPNARHKWLIPVVFLIQVFVIKPFMDRLVEEDKKIELANRPVWELRAELYRKRHQKDALERIEAIRRN